MAWKIKPKIRPKIKIGKELIYLIAWMVQYKLVLQVI